MVRGPSTVRAPVPEMVPPLQEKGPETVRSVLPVRVPG